MTVAEVEAKLRGGEPLTTHEKQVLKMERQRLHIARLRRKIEAGHPKAQDYRKRLEEIEGTQQEAAHAEEIERLRARRRALRGVTVEPQAGAVGTQGAPAGTRS